LNNLNGALPVNTGQSESRSFAYADRGMGTDRSSFFVHLPDLLYNCQLGRPGEAFVHQPAGTGKSGHDGAERQFQSLGNLSIRELLKIKENQGHSMPFVQSIKSLAKRQKIVRISAVRSEIYRFAEFLRCFIKRDLDPRVAFPAHLAITVAEDADQPTLDSLDLSETGT
jgi:hypothetical protein